MNAIDELSGFVSSKLQVIYAIVSIIKLETRLAGLSILPLLVNLCVLLIVLMSTWALIMLVLGYAFYLYFANLLFSLLAICLINCLMLIVLIRYLAFNLKNMSFEKTRELIAQQGAFDDSK